MLKYYITTDGFDWHGMGDESSSEPFYANYNGFSASGVNVSSIDTGFALPAMLISKNIALKTK
jgi:hypothetical protein